MLAITIPLSGMPALPSLSLAVANSNIAEENSVITTPEEVARKEKADAIDAYFAKIDAPLQGYGMKFVIEAEKNGLDWRLLPSIAMRETTGGKFACKNPNAPNNNFGWWSCKKGFNSVDESIEYISRMLGGDSKYYHENMTSEQILKKYNPDHIVLGYSKQVIKIMKTIGPIGEII